MYKFYCYLGPLLTYLSFKVFGFKVTRSYVNDGKSTNRTPVKLNLDRADVEGLLEFANQCYDESKERKNAVAEKCQTLLRTASLLLAAFGFFLPRFISANNLAVKIAFVISVVLLAVSLSLLLTFFKAAIVTVPSFDQKEAELPAIDLKKCIINDLLLCQTAVDNTTDYLVDLYKLARCYFLTAGALFAVIFCSVLIVEKPPADQLGKFVEAFQKNISLIKGKDGERGPQGQSGVPGIKGDMLIINERELVKELINNTKFIEIIKEEITSKDE